ncbi:GNAT superfamily N-acetyltransferase [Amphibacillus cookii]|nr:GNAT superfamily N-acetyltransferase [Amphibacillus cookii]
MTEPEHLDKKVDLLKNKYEELIFITNIRTKALITDQEILSAFPVMQQLRQHLDQQTYLELVKEAQEKDRYYLFALINGKEILSIVGFKPMITLYYGRFIWVCDLITDQIHRSKGYGERLLQFVHQWAKDNHYQSVALSSGLQRIDAHRFYEEKMDYDKVSYVFRKTDIH